MRSPDSSRPHFLRVSVFSVVGSFFRFPAITAIPITPACDRRHSAPACLPARLLPWRHLMSSAAVERVVEQRPKLDLVPSKPTIHERNRAVGPAPAHPCLCGRGCLAHSVSRVYWLDFGVAGAAPFRSHGPVEVRQMCCCRSSPRKVYSSASSVNTNTTSTAPI